MSRSLLIVISFCLFSFLLKGEAADSVLYRNSLRIEVLGKTPGGIGLAFERKFKSGHLQDFFCSWSVETGYPVFPLPYVLAGAGLNANWPVTAKKKIVLNAGLFASGFIALAPSSKYIRQHPDTYGRPIYDPVQPWLMGDFGVKFLFSKWDVKLNFTPAVFYITYKQEFNAGPIGGISAGYNF